jgi:hypothetical protein
MLCYSSLGTMKQQQPWTVTVLLLLPGTALCWKTC